MTEKPRSHRQTGTDILMTSVPQQDPSSSPKAIALAAVARLEAQDAARGEWPDPRRSDQPDPPWPAEGNPVLRYLLHKARKDLADGINPRVVLERLANQAWFEGGVENYDRGQQEARRPHSVE